MKHILLILSMMVLSNTSLAQTANPNYDAKLAAELGADEYGMKSYVLVILKKGSNASTDKALRDEAFRGHMANMERLVADKKLIIAGTFGPNDQDMSGIFIFDVKTVEEVQKIVETDPAISANYLKAELFPWYGSAALATYLPFSDKIWKKSP